MTSSSKKQKSRLRQEHEKKKAQKKKSTRGQSETEYGECKKNASFSLTPTAISNFSQASKRLKISRSELLEQISRLVIWLLADLGEQESTVSTNLIEIILALKT